MTITDYLYQKKPRGDLTAEEVSPIPAPLSRTKSESMLRKRKEGRYQELFSLLKPQDAEFLSADNVQTTHISEEVAQVLKPLIDELATVEESLAYSDFATSMDNLMEQLTPSERAILLGVVKKPPTPSPPTFKPSINKYSPTPAADLYERETARRRVRCRQLLETKRKAQRESRELEETAECTFRPKVTKYVPRKV